MRYMTLPHTGTLRLRRLTRMLRILSMVTAVLLEQLPNIAVARMNNTQLSFQFI